MSVTPDVSHVEMWPYVVSAAALSESHAATAVLMVLSSITVPKRRAAPCVGTAPSTLGQVSKGAVQASINADAVMPELGSHAVRALTPSVVSTKQSTQHDEFRVVQGAKQLAFFDSIAE